MKIKTKYGEVDEKFLDKRVSDDGRVVEYYMNKELVHRSVTLELKGVQAEGIAKL